MNQVDRSIDVAVIGAGPAGSTAAAMLADRGWRVHVIEAARFPRFAIGESLLPQCMDSLAEAGMLDPLARAGFQTKRGVAFGEGDSLGRFSFANATGTNWDWTWHVQRAAFDQIMAEEAERRGASVRFGERVESIDRSRAGAPTLYTLADAGVRARIDARFICDASGGARVLPRLLALEKPKTDTGRAAIFTHVEDRIVDADFEHDSILVTIHPQRPDVWYWLIAFADGRASIGVVGDRDYLAGAGDASDEALWALVAEEPRMARLLRNAVVVDRVRKARHFAAPVSAQQGRDFALLGNAGEFVDPMFSSGVTVALRSAIDAVRLIDRQLSGTAVDWINEFEAPLRRGLNVFRAFVNAWYDGSLKHVFFAEQPPAEVRRSISAVLAGYVWDDANPFVAQPQRRLQTVCKLCAPA